MAAFSLCGRKEEGIKPIVGAELNVCKDMHDKSKKDDGCHDGVFGQEQERIPQPRQVGVQGLHGRVLLRPPDRPEPRLEEFKEDLMVLTGGLFGEVPSLVLNVGETQAEEALVWWKGLMGEDFYAEGYESARPGGGVCGQRLSPADGRKSMDVKLAASNNSYYTRQGPKRRPRQFCCASKTPATWKSTQTLLSASAAANSGFGFPNDSLNYSKSPAGDEGVVRGRP